MVSGIDLCPTLLAAIGLPSLEATDGRSFVDVLKGETDPGRTSVFTHINTIASKRDYSMRSVQEPRFGYIYNAWSDGKTTFRNESQSGRTFKAMTEAAKSDDAIAARVKHFVYRTKEEFYDYANDPAALHNLIDDPDRAADITRFRALMREHMQRAKDPLLERFNGDVAAQ
jgi:N-sulfoglucosamine sulfohydrolase